MAPPLPIPPLGVPPAGSKGIRRQNGARLEMVPLLAGDLLNTLTGHSDTVYSVAISTDGNMVASGSDDKTVRLWNPHTGMPMASHCEPSQRMGGRGWGGGGTSPVGSSPLSSPGTSCHVSFGWHGEWGADWGREASVKGGPLHWIPSHFHKWRHHRSHRVESGFALNICVAIVVFSCGTLVVVVVWRWCPPPPHLCEVLM